MAWMPLTGLDVKNELAQPELDVFNSSLLEPAQTDRLTSIASWVASMVRGRVAAFPQNRNLLDPVPANIPPELYGAAIEVARFKLLTSFPQGKAFLDDSRIATYKDACKQLDDVAKGLIAIEQPPTAQFDLSPSSWNSQDYQGLPDASGVINTPNKWRQGLDASFWH